MACAGRILLWWDREVDLAGRPIRQDVRQAAHEIWEQACQRTRFLLGDDGPAAELMENSVAQVSKYLDRIGATESSGARHALLMVAFCRGLRRHAAKLNRLELIGGSAELAIRAIDDDSVRRVNACIDLESIVQRLSHTSGAVLVLRAAGFEWKEVAEIFGSSVAAVRNRFWREIGKIRK
jgi:DNA-directed RNA polymerase specialized sigma24 family protein